MATRKRRQARKPLPRRPLAKKPVKAKVKRKPNAAFMKPMTPSASLGAVIGAGQCPALK